MEESTIIRERPGILRFIWDMFMVIVTIMNLTLILFDFTYLRFRPTYYERFPKLLELYDPILGIEKHRMTHDYLKYVAELEELVKLKEEGKLQDELMQKLNELEEVFKSLNNQQNKPEINKLLIDVEANKQIENLTQKINSLVLIYKNTLKKIEAEVSFDEYTQLLSKLKQIEKLLKVQSPEGMQEEISSIFEKMDFQMVMIIEENPFVGSGQIHLYKQIQNIIKTEYNKNITPSIDQKYYKLLESKNYTRRKVPSTAVAFAWFWRDESRTLKEKINFFNNKFFPLFDLNYYRNLDMSGKPVSRFWELDAPFYILFLFEFFISWVIAIKRKTFIAWFFYPIYHWYDAVALIPIAEVRIVRLLRLYSMFLMLQSRNYTTFGNDIITRTLRYYSNIIKEELSDMVTIQILTDAQSEIRSGSSMDVVTNALNKNREQIKEVIIEKLSEAGPLNRVGELLSESISNVFSSNDSSFKFLSTDMKEKISKDLILGIFQVLSKSSGSFIQSPAGKVAIGKIIDFILDEVSASAKDEKLNKLNQDITIDLLENIKKQVAVKKWLDTSI